MTQIFERRIAVYLNRNLDMGFFNVPRDVMDSVSPLLLHWQRKREIHERVKGDRNLDPSQNRQSVTSRNIDLAYLLALWTDQCTLILTLE